MVDPPDQERALAYVRGRVHGVGFRWWTRARALELGLVGHARNLPDGRVEVSAQGARAAVEELLTLLAEQPSTRSRPGHVTGVTVQWHPARPDATGFHER
jgi:acylphosphatase